MHGHPAPFRSCWFLLVKQSRCLHRLIKKGMKFKIKYCDFNQDKSWHYFYVFIIITIYDTRLSKNLIKKIILFKSTYGVSGVWVCLLTPRYTMTISTAIITKRVRIMLLSKVLQQRCSKKNNDNLQICWLFYILLLHTSVTSQPPPISDVFFIYWLKWDPLIRLGNNSYFFTFHDDLDSCDHWANFVTVCLCYDLIGLIG